MDKTTFKEQLTEARGACRSMLMSRGWRKASSLLVEKYLALHFAEDPRRLYGALFFDEHEVLIEQEILDSEGVWSTKNLVAAAAIHSASSVVVFSVRRHCQPKKSDTASEQLRVRDSMTALDLVEVDLNGWIIVSGTMTLAVHP